MSIVTGLSVDDYLSGDWDRDTELLFGEVIVTDPTLIHQLAITRLLVALDGWRRTDAGHGLASFGGNWIFGPDTLLKPDMWWISSARREELGELLHYTIPDLAVEVRSPSTWRYDIGPKRTIYEQAGVPELWLVDPPGEVVLVCRRNQGSATYDDLLEVGVGEALTSPQLPGFTLPVAEVVMPTT